MCDGKIEPLGALLTSKRNRENYASSQNFISRDVHILAHNLFFLGVAGKLNLLLWPWTIFLVQFGNFFMWEHAYKALQKFFRLEEL